MNALTGFYKAELGKAERRITELNHYIDTEIIALNDEIANNRRYYEGRLDKEHDKNTELQSRIDDMLLLDSENEFYLCGSDTVLELADNHD